MNLIKCFQTQGLWYADAPRKGRPVGILWHDTAAGNPYLKRYVQPSDDAPDREEMLKILGRNSYGNDWNHSKRTAGVNAFIGKLEDGSIATIQTGEWDIHPYGCGSGKYGSCNGYVSKNGETEWVDPFWIQFEICDDGYVSKNYYNQVYQEAIEFTAYLCKLFNIDPFGTVEFNGQKIPTILCHKEANKYGVGSNHGDIYSWLKALKLPQNMERVKADVAALLTDEKEELKTEPTENTSKNPSSSSESTMTPEEEVKEETSFSPTNKDNVDDYIASDNQLIENILAWIKQWLGKLFSFFRSYKSE